MPGPGMQPECRVSEAVGGQQPQASQAAALPVLSQTLLGPPHIR